MTSAPRERGFVFAKLRRTYFLLLLLAATNIRPPCHLLSYCRVLHYLRRISSQAGPRHRALALGGNLSLSLLLFSCISTILSYAMSIEPLPLETAASRLQDDHAILPDLKGRELEKVEPPSAAAELEQDALFVEGGVRGWCAVSGAFLILLCTFGCT